MKLRPKKMRSELRSAVMTRRSNEQPIIIPSAIYDYLYVMITSEHSTNLIANFQRLCGISIHGKITNQFIFMYFKIASALGDECFYLMPGLFWLAFPLAIPFVTNFLVLLIMGQLTKDLFRLPRPIANKDCISANPLIVLDSSYETEYGLPSTHTMSGLLPIALLLSYSRHSDEQPSASAWLLCAIYATSVALSRLYLGVHSIYDIIGGAVLGGGLIIILHMYGDILDTILYQQWYSIFIILGSTFIFTTSYPGTRRAWTASYGTSAEVFGAWLGLSLAMW